MALKLTTKGAVRLSWADDTMEALFVLKPADSEEELVSKMEQIITFIRSRQGKEPLPGRLPGFALGMAQTAHPAPEPVTGNGWAPYAGTIPAPPEIPADRQGEWELIPPEEQE